MLKRLKGLLGCFLGVLLTASAARADEKTFNNYNPLPCFVTIVSTSGKCFTVGLKASGKGVKIDYGSEVPGLILVVWVDPNGFKTDAFTPTSVANLVKAPVVNLAGHSIFMNKESY